MFRYKVFSVDESGLATNQISLIIRAENNEDVLDYIQKAEQKFKKLGMNIQFDFVRWDD